MKKTIIKACLCLALLNLAVTPVKAGLAFPCVFIGMNMPAKPGKISDAKAEKTAMDWMDCMGSRPIVIPEMKLKMVLEKTSTASNAPLPYYISRNEGPFSLTIGLKDRIHPSMSAKEIERLIDFVANDGVPMPGLEVDNWRVLGMPPSSDLNGTYRVLDVTNNGFTLRIDTKLYAIYGHDNRVVPMADASSPEHAYFNFEKDMKLKMTIRLKIEGF